jgi:hypothetical protein
LGDDLPREREAAFNLRLDMTLEIEKAVCA